MHYELNTAEQYQFLKEKMIELGLIVDGKPLSLAAFKKRLHSLAYGRGKSANRLHLIYSHPKENMFCFSTYIKDTNVEEVKVCYSMYVDFVNGSYEDFQDGGIQWGNSGIPISYGHGKIYYRPEFVAQTI